MAEHSIVVNGDQWPVLLVAWNGEQTNAELEAYFATSDAYLNRREPYVMISVIHSYRNGPGQRERVAAWMKRTDALSRQYCLGSAMVSTSAGFRFALSALFLIKPMPVPYLVCGTLTEAESWVRRQLALRGIEPPRPLSFAAIAGPSTTARAR